MKNHDFGADLKPGEIRNIVVQYRHPLKSLASFFEFLNKRRPNGEKEWEDFVETHFTTWRQFVSRWVLTRPKGNVLYLKYEDLILNPEKQLYRLLRHLGEGQPDQALIKQTIQVQGIRPLSSGAKLGTISEKWISAWEDRHQDLLVSVGISRLLPAAKPEWQVALHRKYADAVAVLQSRFKNLVLRPTPHGPARRDYWEGNTATD